MNTKSPFLTGLSILFISILCNEAMSQTVDTLPSFRNFCTGHTEKPDTVLYYYDAGDSRKTRIIANDTTITDTYYINAYERWIVENGVTIKFRDYVQLVVNGGTLIVGKPKPRWASDPDSSTLINGLRSLTGECTCDQVVLKIDDGNTCWGGIRAKTGTLYMYGTTIYDAKTGLTVADTGDPYYCYQSVASPPPFVWMECCKIQQPPDTGFTFNGLEWAGIHLKGNGASQTIITRTRIDCASRYVWGVRVDGGVDGDSHLSKIKTPESGILILANKKSPQTGVSYDA